MEDFYVVLPSNVHWSAGPPNTTANYKTPLPKPLELQQNKWKVALTEINFPQFWNRTLPATLFDFDIKQEESAGAEILRPIPKNVEYASLRDIINGLNGRIKTRSFQNLFKIKMERVVLVLQKNQAIFMNKMTKTVLGFENNLYQHDIKKGKKPQSFRAEKKIDLLTPTSNMFIYCNLVQESLVGDVLVPLLRTIPIKKEDDEKYVSVSFQHLIYCKLASTFFQHIHIQIADDTGHDIKFKRGKIIATLHFKRIKDE